MKFLTSTQTKRLKDLAAREGDLNEAELSELNFLRNLAEKNKAEDSEEDSPDGDDGTNDGDGDGEEEEDPDEDDPEEEEEEEGGEKASSSKKKKLNIFDRANAVLSSKAKLAKKAKGANADLDAANARIAELEAENKKLQAKADQGEALAKRVADLEQESTTVSQQAASIAATHHVEEDDLPPSTPEGNSPEDLEAQLSELKGAERHAFIRKHRAAIEKAARTKVN